MRRTLVGAFATLTLLLSPSAKADDGAQAAEEAGALVEEKPGPTPEYYSFRTANTFDGKVGIGMLYLSSHPPRRGHGLRAALRAA